MIPNEHQYVSVLEIPNLENMGWSQCILRLVHLKYMNSNWQTASKK